MKRKLISILLALSTVLTMLPMAALAADEPMTETEAPEAALMEEAPEEPEVIDDEDAAAAETTAASQSGTFGANGSNLKWTLNSSGTLTVTGTGAMPEDMLESPWFDLRDQIKKVVISNGVTNIGDYAFMLCDNLTTLTVANSVTSIGSGAFRQSPLTSVSIGTGAKKFGSQPFFQDPWAKAQGDLVIINHVLVEVNQSAGALQTISIPSGVTEISEEAFAECPGPTSIIIPDTVTTFAENAFLNDGWSSLTGLTSLTIPASVTTIGEHAFGFKREYVDDQTVYTVNPDFTAKVYAGSAAETWCKANGVAYTVIGSNGWQQIGSSWYYYENGKAVTGWKQISSKWYYFSTTGVMQSGWQKISGKWYYLKNYMLTGWQKIDGKWYYLKNYMLTGWQKIDGKWYYLNTDMKTGWQKIDGKWYYLKNYMLTGWQKIDGKWYYLNTSMQTGWQKINGTWYYLKSNGAMACSETLTIDGTAYTFDANGIYSTSHT